MNYLARKLQKLSLRSRILITFSTIVFLISIVLSFISYFTVKRIYLNQLEEQVDLLTRNLISDMNTKFLDLIQPSGDKMLAREYYQKELSEKMVSMGFEEVYIFNQDFELLVHANLNNEGGNLLPSLLLNKRKIINLKVDESITSDPFRGKDDQWYLWGFYRFQQKFFLGVREDASRLAEVDQLALLFFLIGLISLLLTLIMGWILAIRIYKPIQNLVYFSREIGKGNFTATVPKNIYGELAILSQSLDKMRLDLQDHHQEKENMLAQIAHELRNPLGGIELLAGLVKEDLTKAGQNAEYINKISREIHTLKNLINDYLNFSRPIQANPEKIKLSETLENVKEILLDKLQSKNITIQSHFNEDYIRFDPRHIRHILMNLIANSIEASPPYSLIEIIQRKENEHYVLMVTDQGNGIQADHIDKIFNPFFSTRENGAGLGLAICKKLCQENNSEIWVENNADRGCTFFISGRLSENRNVHRGDEA